MIVDLVYDYICIYMSLPHWHDRKEIDEGELPGLRGVLRQRPRGGHQALAPAHDGPGGPTRAWPTRTHRGPQGPRGLARAWPARAQGGPQGPGPQEPIRAQGGPQGPGPHWPRGPARARPTRAQQGLAHEGPGSRTRALPTRAQGGPLGIGPWGHGGGPLGLPLEHSGQFPMGKITNENMPYIYIYVYIY